ncbi:MAG: carboxymuconolactone decarboxylase family protein [Chloroflexota bacterium]
MTPLPPFLQRLAAIDPEFVEQAATIREQAYYTPSALDVKTKLLIALALDVAHGAEEGVRLLSARAREAGATDAEIADVLRICYSVAGLQRLSTGANAFG